MNEKAYDDLILKIMHDESIFYSFMLNSAMSKGFSSLTMLHSGLHSIIYTVIGIRYLYRRSIIGKMTFLGEHPLNSKMEINSKLNENHIPLEISGTFSY